MTLKPLLLCAVLSLTLPGVAPLHAQENPPQTTPTVEDRQIRRPDQAVLAPGAQPTQTIERGLDLERVALAMAIVIGLILLLKVAARKWLGLAPVGGGRAVKLLARTTLTPRQQVMLIQVGRRVIVVGDSAGQLSSLASIDDPDEVAELMGSLRQPSPAVPGAFESTLNEETRQFEASEDKPDPLERIRGELGTLMERVRSVRGSLDKQPPP